MAKTSRSSSGDVTRNWYQFGRSANNIYNMYKMQRDNFFIMRPEVFAEYTHILLRNYGQSEIMS
jgi:hypothetical protein